MSNHALLAAALVVAVYSLDPGEGIYARVGMPSDGYLLIGLLLTVGAAFLCASSHCEYIGWSPASSRVVRRVKIDWSARRELGYRAAEALNWHFPPPARLRPSSSACAAGME